MDLSTDNRESQIVLIDISQDLGLCRSLLWGYVKPQLREWATAPPFLKAADLNLDCLLESPRSLKNAGV